MINDLFNVTNIDDGNTLLTLKKPIRMNLIEARQPEVAMQFDEFWFFYIPLVVSIERIAKRHMHTWNFSHTQAMQRTRKSDVLNAELVVSTKKGQTGS